MPASGARGRQALRLEVKDWAGPSRWRWLLSGPGGEFLADHEVDLEAPGGRDAPGWEGFTDLEWFLRWRAAIDRRLEHEAELLTEVGEWITEWALGRGVAQELARRPGPVHLVVPPGPGQMLAYRPWQAARVHGRTLAESKVTFVTDPLGRPPTEKRPVGEKLRMLAVFSLPEDTTALNLRRERYALARLVNDIAKTNGRAVELRVLQYGATRRRLEAALLEAEGWDVLHMSGHGLPAGLVLEDDTGRRDLIETDDLVDLIGAASDHLKLITLSACESAALTAEDHLRLLGLTPPGGGEPGRGPDGTPPGDGAERSWGVPGHGLTGSTSPPRPTDGAGQSPWQGDDAGLSVLATSLVDRVDAAVLAMRYPVADDFAIGLAERFYDLVLGKGQPVDRALGLTLTLTSTPTRVIPPEPTSGVPALSAATPALFGNRALGLELIAPEGEPLVFQAERVKLARFPDQPARFVGRVGPMTRAATALAPRSKVAGVLFHGMAGAGKTACAVELAYAHQEAFQLLVWHQAPQQDQDIAAAFTTVAADLEAQIPGLRLMHLADSIPRLTEFLPTLTEFLERNRVLLVLDNLESLLTSDGKWRDERWRLLIEAVTVPDGLSRVILTSRTCPAGLPAGVRTEPVHALALQESVLLAREWPHLKALIDTPTRGRRDPRSGRGLAARVLAVVQGHPKLIELADGQAADPVTLAARLDEIDTAWLTRGIRLQDFLDTGHPQGSDQDYYQVLSTWTRAAAQRLPTASGALFTLLAGLEDDDRTPVVVDTVWPILWRELGHPDPAPSIDVTVGPLLEQALVAVDNKPGTNEVVRYRIHPGVAETVRSHTPPDTTRLIDTNAAGLWQVILASGLEREREGLGEVILYAAKAAAPYLARNSAWGALVNVLDEVLIRDLSPDTAAALLPFLQAAAEATVGTDPNLEVRCGFTHARALARLRPIDAEPELRRLHDLVRQRGEHDAAAVIAGELANRYLEMSRFEEALTLLDQMQEDSRAAGYGPWSQLSIEGRQLQIRMLQGHSREVLDAVDDIRAHMATLPDPSDQVETIQPWNVREAILDTGRSAASDLEKWQLALDLNAEHLRVMKERGATEWKVAQASFNDYGPLRALGRLNEARALLLRCRDIDEAHHDITGLAKDLGALADIEDKLGHGQAAIALQRDALRLTYTTGDITTIGVGHHNLANFLDRYTHETDQAWAHRLAGAVIVYQTNSGLLHGQLATIARLLHRSDVPPLPASFDQVCAMVDQIDGVHLAALSARLPRRAADEQAALDEVLALARAIPSEQVLDMPRYLQMWEPVVSALVATVGTPGNERDESGGTQEDQREQAAAFLDRALDPSAQTQDWAALAAVLRRVRAGDRDRAALAAGLDKIDTVILTRTLAALDGSDPIAPMLWAIADHGDSVDESDGAGMPEFLATVVAAAQGSRPAAEFVGPILDQMSEHAELAALAGALRAILDGDRSPTLTAGLNPEMRPLIDAVLSVLAE
ncbi:CHAT domain-containing protein [Streptomyces sp. BK340]|uniref:CHAT domain-containing protein n=1 Tax=Streptomyces sp. BK340 TaxID=2572903 RepID=UPI00119E0932|nr:CHAT domain-containing protein [Streptomyces sp. BK340]TVZ98013.1 NB-ARC domain-containing protein [Streptomyces sp. BK340]